MKTAVVGHIRAEVVALLGLEIIPQPIFWGESNREHVETNHPAMYAKYASTLAIIISDILGSPDYVGSRNGAIEYVKVMPDGEILKIAVRASKKGVYFARTVYPIKQDELDNFLSKNSLVKLV